LNIAIWIAQVGLALVFVAAGLAKLRQPREELAPKMGWVEDFSDGFVKFVGGVEVLGALGLILPAALGIVPILTPIAAAAWPWPKRPHWLSTCAGRNLRSFPPIWS
jgi:uncharacterized membrane protein YphA (DoxX/SURF4 family)